MKAEHGIGAKGGTGRAVDGFRMLSGGLPFVGGPSNFARRGIRFCVSCWRNLGQPARMSRPCFVVFGGSARAWEDGLRGKEEATMRVVNATVTPRGRRLSVTEGFN
jgi:hypothetical protein